MSDSPTKYPVHKRHDLGYKHLLSNKALFLQLLQSFTDAEWIAELEPNSLTKVNTSYITAQFSLKEADLIYQAKFKDQDLIFYLLTELQSEVDFTMPFRLLTYMYELWRDIQKHQPEREVSRKSFRLPAVIPILLYTGDQKWTPVRQFKQILQGHEYCGDYILNFSYYVIDINHYHPDQLIDLSNRIGAIFLLDQKYDIMEFQTRLTSIYPIISQQTPQEFQDFLQWIKYSICPKLPTDLSEEVQHTLQNFSLKEVDQMGLADNIVRGLDKARREGIIEGHIEIAKNMLRRGLPLEAVVEITELPLEQVLSLYEEIQQETN